MWGSEEKSDCEGEKKGRSDSNGNLHFAFQKEESIEWESRIDKKFFQSLAYFFKV